MKKILLASICTLALAGVALAQGNVNWSGPSAAGFTVQTNATAYSPLFGGGSTGGGTVGTIQSATTAPNAFYFELLYTNQTGYQVAASSPSLTALGGWTDSSLTATNGSTSGRTATINPNPGQTLSAFTPGTTNNIIMVGWSSDLGTTWGGANGAYAHIQSSTYLASLGTQQAFFGVSTVGYTTGLASTVSTGAALFGSAATASGLPIFSLNTQLYLIPVPEPGTMALAALGGASLLLFRRRK